MRTTVLVLMLLIPSPLLADTVTPSNDFSASGDFTFAGGNVCPTCAENLAFSFDFDYTRVYESDVNATLYFPAITNVTDVWSGSLGVTGGQPGPAVLVDGVSYLPLFDSAGDEVDINSENSSDSGIATLEGDKIIQYGAPSAPVIYGSFLYSCAGSACKQDFMPVFSAYGVGGTLSNVSVTQIQSVHTPELSSLAMLGISLVIGGIFWTIKKNQDRNLLSRS